METITIQKAQITVKWPIYSAWPHCAGSCTQGRTLCLSPELCQHGEVADEWEPLPLRDQLAFWVPVVVCTGFVLGLFLLALGVRI